MVLGVVDDVLPDSLEPAAVQVDDRAHACEIARDLGAQTLERVSVDLDRKLGEEIERGHGPSIVIDLRAGPRAPRRGVPGRMARSVDLTLSPKEQAFRDELRAWLAANDPGGSRSATRRHSSSGAPGSAS